MSVCSDFSVLCFCLNPYPCGAWRKKNIYMSLHYCTLLAADVILDGVYARRVRDADRPGRGHLVSCALQTSTSGRWASVASGPQNQAPRSTGYPLFTQHSQPSRPPPSDRQSWSARVVPQTAQVEPSTYPSAARALGRAVQRREGVRHGVQHNRLGAQRVLLPLVPLW